jgi:hypothetical protein
VRGDESLLCQLTRRFVDTTDSQHSEPNQSSRRHTENVKLLGNTTTVSRLTRSIKPSRDTYPGAYLNRIEACRPMSCGVLSCLLRQVRMMPREGAGLSTRGFRTGPLESSATTASPSSSMSLQGRRRTKTTLWRTLRKSGDFPVDEKASAARFRRIVFLHLATLLTMRT